MFELDSYYIKIGINPQSEYFHALANTCNEFP